MRNSRSPQSLSNSKKCKGSPRSIVKQQSQDQPQSIKASNEKPGVGSGLPRASKMRKITSTPDIEMILECIDDEKTTLRKKLVVQAGDESILRPLDSHR